MKPPKGLFDLPIIHEMIENGYRTTISKRDWPGDDRFTIEISPKTNWVGVSKVKNGILDVNDLEIHVIRERKKKPEINPLIVGTESQTVVVTIKRDLGKFYTPKIIRLNHSFSRINLLHESDEIDLVKLYSDIEDVIIRMSSQNINIP